MYRGIRIGVDAYQAGVPMHDGYVRN